MKDLSIVIRADEEDIKNYIEIIKPLIFTNQCELLFINNQIDTVDIPYNYSIYRFTGEYSKFKEFCFISSTGKRLMIIEKGMLLTPELIQEIQCTLEDSDYFNITCNIKRYINMDKTLSFTDEFVIVYNRGIKGFNKNTGLMLEDLSLIDANEEEIKINIEKLIKGKFYNELYLWYENFILNLPKQSVLNFYIYLEKKKYSLEKNDIEAIDNLFIQGKAEDKYVKYLSLRELYRKDKDIYSQIIIDKLKEIELNKEDIYFSWLIMDFFDDKKYFIDLLKAFDECFQRDMLCYLLDNNGDFLREWAGGMETAPTSHFNNHRELMGGMETNYTRYSINNRELTGGIETNNNGNDFSRVLTYINIIKIYMEYTMKYSSDPQTKSMLLELLNHFSDYFTLLINNGYKIKDEALENFITEFSKGKALEDDGKFQAAIDVLKNTCIITPKFFKIVQYYIKRLRFKYNYYPYTLSICMIVKDEEKNLDRCLKSLKPILDNNIAELIIVDTGSRDKSIEIAKKYTNKIFTHKWENNFSEARNYSVSLADGEYVFVLDADEEFEAVEMDKLIKVFSDKSYKEYNSFSFKLKNYSDVDLAQFVVLTQARIFKNNGLFYYSSSVHNQPIFSFPINNLDITLLHYGYIMTEDIREKKFQRTATLLKRELEKNPKNIYYRFQLSTSYAMYGNYNDALKQVQIYMRLIEEDSLNEDHLMYLSNAASIYINNFLYDEAEKICDEAIKIKPDFIDFIFYKAFILFFKEKYNESISYINKYLSLIDDYYKLEIASDGRYSFYSLGDKDNVLKLFIIASSRIGEYVNCINATHFIKNDSILRDCLHSLIKSYFVLGKYNELSMLYKSRVVNSCDASINSVFNFFLMENLFNSSNEEVEKCVSSFSSVRIQDSFIEKIRARLNGEKNSMPNEILNIIDKFDMDTLELQSALEIFSRVMPVFQCYDIANSTDYMEMRKLKIFAQAVLHRTQKLLDYEALTKEELVLTFQRYMGICSKLMKSGNRDLLEVRERFFIANILNAVNELIKGNNDNTIQFFRDSVIVYREMRGIIDLAIELLVPGYYKGNGDNDIEANDEMEEYISNLKFNIMQGFNAGSTRDLIKLFEKYDNEDWYDSQLYSFKGAALMAEGMLYEAEKCLQRGLRKYSSDIHILSNLSRLYSLKGEYKKSIEFYSKAYITASEKDIPNVFEIIPREIIQHSNENLKVLQGTMDFSDRTITIANALKENGISVKTLNYITKGIGYSSDYVMDVHSFDSGETILKRTIDASSKLISEFDVFHFHYGTTLTFNQKDLPVLKELNKGILMNFWGQDVRLFSIASKFNPYVKFTNYNSSNEEEIKNKLNRLGNFIPCCIVGDYELAEYVKDYFNNVRVINPMIDVEKYKPFYNNKSSKFTIVHAPKSRELKGTDFIIKAVDDLKSKYDINLIILQGAPHDKAVKMYRDADLIIDQLLVGSYGQFSIEGMALGKPVICYISDFMKDKYPKDLPLISGNPDNIKEVIENAVKNKDSLIDIGLKGRLYVEKYHDIKKEIKKIIDLYKEFIH